MARRRVTVKNLRVAGQRIPDKVFRDVAEELIGGSGPSESERKHGSPSKAQMLASLCETDRAWRVKVQKAVLKRKADEAKKIAAESGYDIDFPAGPEASNDDIDRHMWELYRRTLVHDLERYGAPQATNVRGQAVKITCWHTPNGDVPLLTPEERDYALSRFVGGPCAPIEVKTLPAPPYVPSGIDWVTIQREVAAEERAAAVL